MNLENLEFASQREVCEYIGIEYKDSTCSRRAREKEFDRIWKWHKEGRKIIVDEVYSEIREKIDNRGKSEGSRNNNKGIYGKYLDPLIENFLYNKSKDRNIICISNNCIAQSVKMVSCNYRICNSNKWTFHKYLYSNFLIYERQPEYDVFDAIYSKLRKPIENSLDRLQKLEKIKYYKTYMIYPNKIQATKEQIEIIEEIQLEIKEEMGIDPEKEFLPPSIREEFYKRVNKIVNFLLDIKGYYQGYVVTINNVKEQKNVKQLQEKLNHVFTTQVKKSISKKLEISAKKQEPNKYDKNRISDGNYLHKTDKIIDIIVNLNATRIVEIIENMIDE